MNGLLTLQINGGSVVPGVLRLIDVILALLVLQHHHLDDCQIEYLRRGGEIIITWHLCLPSSAAVSRFGACLNHLN